MELHISVFYQREGEISGDLTALQVWLLFYGIGNYLFILFVVLVVCYFIARIKVVRACCLFTCYCFVLLLQCCVLTENQSGPQVGPLRDFATLQDMAQ